jgi:hypothetical protein
LTLRLDAVTRALCPPGSLSEEYLRQLGRVESYYIQDGGLFLIQSGGAGTMEFDLAGG